MPAHGTGCAARIRFPRRAGAGPAARAGHAARGERHLDVHRFRHSGPRATVDRPDVDVRVRRGLRTAPPAGRGAGRRTHRGAHPARSAVQSMAPLRQDATIPRRPAGHRRRDLQLQPDLRSGHDGRRAGGGGAARLLIPAAQRIWRGDSSGPPRCRSARRGSCRPTRTSAYPKSRAPHRCSPGCSTDTSIAYSPRPNTTPSQSITSSKSRRSSIPLPGCCART